MSTLKALAIFQYNPHYSFSGQSTYDRNSSSQRESRYDDEKGRCFCQLKMRMLLMLPSKSQDTQGELLSFAPNSLIDGV
jgi:hypothetical protein